MESIIAVFIPIIVTLVIGLVIVVDIYFRSKEKQMLIEKGLTVEERKRFLEEKRDPFRMLKIGMISIFFGLGLGFGMMLQNATGQDYWIPLLLFIGTGIGFVLDNVIGNKLKQQNKSD